MSSDGRNVATDLRFLRCVTLHIGFLRSLDENLLPLMDVLMSNTIEDFDSVVNRTSNALALLRTEHNNVSGLIESLNAFHRDPNERSTIRLMSAMMFSSLEHKAKFFREILTRLQSLCVKLEKKELADDLNRFQPHFRFQV